MANGDSTLLLVEELFSGPWRDLMDAVFYLGAVYGAYKVTQVIAAAMKGFRTYFIPLGRAVNSDLERYGQWAVVTGATSTLGTAFANEIARNGLNVVLVSHNEQSMRTLREHIQKQHGVQAVGLCCTIGSGEKMLTSLKETLITLNLEIGLLVNINPIQYVHPQYFSLVPHTRLWQLISRNIAPMTMMTHLVLPAMVERRRGAIINVSSSLSTAPPTPLLGAYSATMSYITHLSLALHRECSSKGVTVQTLVPWRISSDRSTSPFSPTASTYVRHALSTLDVSHYCCGYWLHGVQSVFYGLWPDRLWTWASSYFNNQLRRAGLTKSMEQENPQIFLRRQIYGGSSIPSTAGRLKPVKSPDVERPVPILHQVTSSVPCNIAVDGDMEEKPAAASFLSLQQQPRDAVFSSGRTMEVLMGRGGYSYKQQFSNIIALPSATSEYESSVRDLSATL